MERPRASLSLQIPSSLLPSSRAPGLLDSDSQDSLEEGLTLRPVTAYGRSASGPPASTASRAPPQGPAGVPQRSVTFPTGGKTAAAAVSLHVDATSGGSHGPQAPTAVLTTAATTVQRVGSRQPSSGSAGGGSSSGSTAGDAAAAPPAAASEASAGLASAPSASQRALSPQPASERYSEQFEAEDDSRSQAPTSPGVPSSSGTAPRSTCRPASRPASAAVGRTGSGSSPARSPAARQLPRSGSARPGYLSSTAAMEAKRGTPAASKPSSRPGSASPAKQPSRCGRSLLWLQVLQALACCSELCLKHYSCAAEFRLLALRAAAGLRRQDVPCWRRVWRGSSRRTLLTGRWARVEAGQGRAGPLASQKGRVGRVTASTAMPVNGHQKSGSSTLLQVLEVCDWLEIIGLGQYRRRFVHHAVCGSLLLALGPEELKVGAGTEASGGGEVSASFAPACLECAGLASYGAAAITSFCAASRSANLVVNCPPPLLLQTELGIGPLGHREGLLTAIHDLDTYWAQRQAEGNREDASEGSQDGDWEIRAGRSQGRGGGSAGGSRSPSPPLAGGDYGLQRAYAQRARLMKDLEKAEAREAQRMK